jgi:hypothetical protein
MQIKKDFLKIIWWFQKKTVPLPQIWLPNLNDPLNGATSILKIVHFLKALKKPFG